MDVWIWPRRSSADDVPSVPVGCTCGVGKRDGGSPGQLRGCSAPTRSGPGPGGCPRSPLWHWPDSLRIQGTPSHARRHSPSVPRRSRTHAHHTEHRHTHTDGRFSTAPASSRAGRPRGAQPTQAAPLPAGTSPAAPGPAGAARPAGPVTGDRQSPLFSISILLWCPVARSQALCSTGAAGGCRSLASHQHVLPRAITTGWLWARPYTLGQRKRRGSACFVTQWCSVKKRSETAVQEGGKRGQQREKEQSYQGCRDELCQAAQCQGSFLRCSLPNGILIPSRDGDGTRALPSQPHLPPLPARLFPVPCPNFGVAGAARSPAPIPALPVPCRDPVPRGSSLQFGVTRASRKRLAADSWDKERKAAIQTTASLPGRARPMPGDSHYCVSILGHHKNPHSSPRKNRPAPDGSLSPPKQVVTPGGKAKAPHPA